MPIPPFLNIFRRTSGAFYGWKLVGLSFLILPLSSLALHGSGTLVVALERHFGWSRTVLSGAFAIGRVQDFFQGPIEGVLIDRFGPRRMIMVGFLLMGIGFVLLSLMQTVWHLFVALAVLRLGVGLGGWLAMITAVNNWFIKRRTLAFSIAMAGVNGTVWFSPVVAVSIEAFGYQRAILSMGVILIAIAIPVGRLVRNYPEEYGLVPDGRLPAVESDEASGDEEEPEPAFTAKEALTTRAFWFIAIANVASAVPIVTLAIHLVPKLTDIGLSILMAGVVVATYAVVTLPVQFLSGYLGDKFPKPPLIFVFLSLQAVALMVIAMTTSLSGAFLFAALFGVASGAAMPLLSIRGEYFGRKSFATIMALSNLPSNFMLIFVPVFAGYMFDTTGSYFVSFSFLAALSILGAFLILFAKKPKPKEPMTRAR